MEPSEAIVPQPERVIRRRKKRSPTLAVQRRVQRLCELQVIGGKSLREACEEMGISYEYTKNLLCHTNVRAFEQRVVERLFSEMERQTTKAVTSARHKVLRKMAQLSDKANDRVSEILEPDGADAKTQMVAVKTVYGAVGVSDSAQVSRPSVFISDEDKAFFKKTLDTLGVVMQPRVIESEADVIDVEYEEA